MIFSMLLILTEVFGSGLRWGVTRLIWLGCAAILLQQVHCNSPCSTKGTCCVCNSLIAYNGGCLDQCPEGTYKDVAQDWPSECIMDADYLDTTTDSTSSTDTTMTTRTTTITASTTNYINTNVTLLGNTTTTSHPSTSSSTPTTSVTPHIVKTGNFTCYECYSGCKSCINGEEDVCTSCKPGFYKQYPWVAEPATTPKLLTTEELKNKVETSTTEYSTHTGINVSTVTMTITTTTETEITTINSSTLTTDVTTNSPKSSSKISSAATITSQPVTFQCVEKCLKPYYHDNNSMSCVFNLDCKDGQYADKISRFCEACDEACTTCYGPSPTQCKECAVGYSYTSNDNHTKCEKEPMSDLDLIIGLSAGGGAALLVIIAVVVGVVCYRRMKKWRSEGQEEAGASMDILIKEKTRKKKDPNRASAQVIRYTDNPSSVREVVNEAYDETDEENEPDYVNREMIQTMRAENLQPEHEYGNVVVQQGRGYYNVTGDVKRTDDVIYGEENPNDAVYGNDDQAVYGNENVAAGNVDDNLPIYGNEQNEPAIYGNEEIRFQEPPIHGKGVSQQKTKKTQKEKTDQKSQKAVKYASGGASNISNNQTAHIQEELPVYGNTEIQESAVPVHVSEQDLPIYGNVNEITTNTGHPKGGQELGNLPLYGNVESEDLKDYVNVPEFPAPPPPLDPRDYPEDDDDADLPPGPAPPPPRKR